MQLHFFVNIRTKYSYRMYYIFMLSTLLNIKNMNRDFKHKTVRVYFIKAAIINMMTIDEMTV